MAAVIPVREAVLAAVAVVGQVKMLVAVRELRGKAKQAVPVGTGTAVAVVVQAVSVVQVRHRLTRV
tara:strand:- start:257 stop:454 length:198 start_codon:yes stop_codon:yes gene_type:complete